MRAKFESRRASTNSQNIGDLVELMIEQAMFEEEQQQMPKARQLLENLTNEVAPGHIKATLAFTSYHIVKTGLWHYGYGATFFYRTRFLSIPVYFYGLYYICGPWVHSDLRQVNLEDYYNKKKQFERHTAIVDKMVFTRK